VDTKKMPRYFSGIGLMVLAVFLLESPAMAQGDGADEKESFAIRTLAVSVVDGEGHLVPGLVPDDFKLVERGIERDVTEVTEEKKSLDILLLVDTSVAFTNDVTPLRRALDSFVRAAAGQNNITLYEFGTRPRKVAEPTSDSSALARAVKGLHPRQEAAYLLDAIGETGEKLAETEREEGNPVHVVMVTAMGPELSSLNYRQVQDIGLESRAVYHTVIYENRALAGDVRRQSEVNDTLDRLTRETGGTLIRVLASPGIESGLLRIVDELRPRYLISFLTETKPKSDAKELSVDVPAHTAQVEILRLLPGEKIVPASK
jgi:VWFA-related protein